MRPQGEEADSGYKYSACAGCEQGIRAYCRLPVKKRSIERAFKYADAHLSNGDLAASYKGIRWIDNAIDCDEWRPMERGGIPGEFRLPKTANRGLQAILSSGDTDSR